MASSRCFPKFHSIVSFFSYLKTHITTTEQCNETILVTPSIWDRCHHSAFTPGECLGEGGFGQVYEVTNDPSLCMKKINKRSALYKEAALLDFIHLANLVQPCVAADKILQMIFACSKCQCIVLPKMKCSLDTYRGWHPIHMDALLTGFRGLVDALSFLNFTCGLTHCDVSPSNLLVGLGGLADLVLSDLGISTMINCSNTPTKIRVCSREAGEVASLSVFNSPFYFGKKTYRPSTFLFSCYQAIKVNKKADGGFSHWDTPEEGLRLDLACLYYSFQDCLLGMLGFSHRKLDEFPRSTPPPDRAGKYLSYMLQRTVVTHLLCSFWSLSVETGLDIDGGSSNIHIPRNHRTYFKNLCDRSLALLHSNFSPQRARAVFTEPVKVFCLQLLKLDSFNWKHGEVDFSGFFLQG